MIKANVTKFADGKDIHGEIVVLYTVEVVLTENKSSYTIIRRYSDFAQLHNQVKDIISPAFRFPNKSLFHNSSQFTKERRLRGFDELVNLLAGMKPVPHELYNFLDIDVQTNKRTANSTYSRTIDPDSINLNAVSTATDTPSDRVSTKTKSVKYSNNNNNTNTNGGSESRPVSIKPDTTSDTAWKDKMSRLSRHVSDAQSSDYPTKGDKDTSNKSLSNDHTTTNNTTTNTNNHPSPQSLQDIIKNEMSKIIQSSLQLSGAIYFGLIMCGIIDVSNSTYARMLITYMTLALVFAFILILSIKFSIAED